MIADRRFLKGLNTADGVGGLRYRAIDIPDSFSLHGLDIAICYQTAYRSADGVSGTIISKH